MTVVAHVGGLPLEELLPTLAGTGTAVLVARGWISLRLRRSAGGAPAREAPQPRR